MFTVLNLLSCLGFFYYFKSYLKETLFAFFRNVSPPLPSWFIVSPSSDSERNYLPSATQHDITLGCKTGRYHNTPPAKTAVKHIVPRQQNMTAWSPLTSSCLLSIQVLLEGGVHGGASSSWCASGGSASSCSQHIKIQLEFVIMKH